jgi:hypothetical protein
LRQYVGLPIKQVVEFYQQKFPQMFAARLQQQAANEEAKQLQVGDDCLAAPSPKGYSLSCFASRI